MARRATRSAPARYLHVLCEVQARGECELMKYQGGCFDGYARARGAKCPNSAHRHLTSSEKPSQNEFRPRYPEGMFSLRKLGGYYHLAGIGPSDYDCEAVRVASHASSGICDSFIPEKEFTKDLVVAIAAHVYRNALGGLRGDWYNRDLSRYLFEIRIQFPEWFEDVCQAALDSLNGSSYVERQIAIARASYVGKTAVLRTLTPGVGTFAGGFEWDGTWFSSSRGDRYQEETRYRPTLLKHVEITDERQVNPGTVFVKQLNG